MVERTLVIIKPDGVARGLTGQILSRYESAGLTPVRIEMMQASQALISKHFPDEERYLLSLAEKGRAAGENLDTKEKKLAYGMRITKGLREFMTSGPVVAFILEGEDAVKRVRAITGYTDPAKAGKGTVRGDFATDSIETANKEGRPVRNLVHASGTIEEAKAEINLWFREMSGG